MPYRSSKTYDTILSLPFAGAKLGIRVGQNALYALDFVGPKVAEKLPTTDLTRRIVAQLLAYYVDPNAVFSLPLDVTGTSFQKRVWRALRKIPVGQVLSYGQLGRQLKTSARAIGNACRANQIPIIIPCHRVVAAHGIGGFSGKLAGRPLDIKRWLLTHESRH